MTQTRWEEIRLEIRHLHPIRTLRGDSPVDMLCECADEIERLRAGVEEYVNNVLRDRSELKELLKGSA